MDQDLLRCLLAAFPADHELVISGYLVPFEAVVDESLPRLLASRYRNGICSETLTGIDRG